MNCVLYAVFVTVGVARARVLPPQPMAVFSPSDQPSAGLWQLAHAIAPLPDRRGSKNRACPSFTRSAVTGLSAGAVTAGRRHCRSATLGAGTSACAWARKK